MEENCRLCGGIAKTKFTLNILARHEVNYFECSVCGSLQTEAPYWLEVAYGIPGVHVDVGQAARVIQMWARMCFFLEAIGFDKRRPCVDYGGSAGLLTRLMRDSGYHYLAFDTYDSSKYANYFKVDQLHDVKPDLISAFEVFEHFPDPAKSLNEILAEAPELVVFSTQFYEGQGPDWPYLVPFCGQHVFFYRQQALADFCELRGYALRRTPDFWVLVRKAGDYSTAVEVNKSSIMSPAFAADLLVKVGYGTDSTERDFSYAKDRFQREIEAASRKERSGLQGFLNKAITALFSGN